MKSIANINSKNNKLAELKNKGMNDSSKNYFLENNSLLLKDKLNNDNSKELNNEQQENQKKPIISNLSDNKIYNNNNSIDNYIFKMNKNNISFLKNKQNEFNENYHDIMLNKSNKTQIFLIKIYIIIIVFFIIVISAFIGYKIILTLGFKSLINSYFTDYISITNRYSILIYYFNVLRTLFIFPDDIRKKEFEDIMENLNIRYEEENIKYNEILSERINNYKETKILLEILQSKQNSTKILKDIICVNKSSCELYLNSKYNIFNSGLDSAYKTCINQIKNIYMDYKKLSNKININEIKEKITNVEHSQFEYISASINNIFSNALEKIFSVFKIDQLNFKNNYSSNMTLLNIISVIFSILTFLFVNIIIFFSISIFSKPIKNSTYRINCSFYYIKKYNLNIKKN